MLYFYRTIQHWYPLLTVCFVLLWFGTSQFRRCSRWHHNMAFYFTNHLWRDSSTAVTIGAMMFGFAFVVRINRILKYCSIYRWLETYQRPSDQTVMSLSSWHWQWVNCNHMVVSQLLKHGWIKGKYIVCALRAVYMTNKRIEVELCAYFMLCTIFSTCINKFGRPIDRRESIHSRKHTTRIRVLGYFKIGPRAYPNIVNMHVVLTCLTWDIMIR